MVRSKRNHRQRGGSNASDNVEALVAKTCHAYPEPIQHVITGQDLVQQNRGGVPYQIGAGRASRDASRASWFTTRFIPALTARIEAGDTPGVLVSYMLRTWNRRYREYMAKIKTGSPYEVARVLRDLYILKGDKNLSFGERKMFDTAKALLVKELAVSKAEPEPKIEAKISEIFSD